MTANFLTNVDQYNKAELDGIESRLHKILGHEHPIFTDHSINHSKRVVENIDTILNEKKENFELLTQNEKLCLGICCLLHDVGMNYHRTSSRRKREEIELEIATSPIETRKKHSKISGYLIRLSGGIIDGEDSLKIDLKNSFFKNMVEDIAWICENHSGNVTKDDLCSFSTLGREKFRRGLLLCLLRLGDELDRTFERVNMNTIRMMSIPPESLLHWYMHYYTKSVIIEKGIIKVFLRFPLLPADAPSKLKALIIEKIMKETDLLKIPLMEWGIGLHFDDKSVDTENVNNLEIPDDNVLDLLNDIDDSITKQNVFNTLKGTKNWIQHWNFNGDPWFDKLLGAGSELLVRTNSMNEFISETLSIAKGEGGGIRLIVAKRRAGKSTLYQVMNEILTQEGCRSYYIETLNTERTITSGKDLFYYVQRRATDIAMEILGDTNTEEYNGKKDFKATFNKTDDKNVVIFLDNLDRLVYQDEKEKEIIIEFLTLLQTLTDQVQEKWYVLICVPSDWMEMLKEESFSYLRPELGHSLEAFSISETDKLISARIKWAGRDPKEIINLSGAEKLRELCNGLPGLIIQNAELIFRNAFINGIDFIDGNIVEEYCSTNLSIIRKKVAIELTSKSIESEKGLALLYDFQRIVERLQKDSITFFRIVDNSIERKQKEYKNGDNLEFLPVEIPFALYSSPLNIILDRKEERISIGLEKSHMITYNIRKEVKTFLKGLESKGIDSKLFLMEFSKHPFRPAGFKESDKKVEQFVLNLPQINSLNDAYDYLSTSSNKSLSNTKRINSAWNAVLSGIFSVSIELRISPPKIESENKLNNINKVKLEMKAVNDWLFDVQQQNKLFLTSKSLIDHIGKQALSSAHIKVRGHSKYSLDPEMAYFSAKSVINEFKSKFLSK